MVSRDTALQVMAVVVGVALLGVWATAERWTGAPPGELTPVDLLFGAGYAFVVLAGAHLYLAARDEGGSIPVGARWRFVAVVLGVTALLAFATLLSEAGPILGVRPELPVVATAGALAIGYLLFEAREGYRESVRG